MEGLSPFFIDPLIPILLVLVTAVLVAIEAAMLASSRERLESEECKNLFGRKWAIRIVENLNRNLLTVQLGIGSAILLLGWWGIVSLNGWLIKLLEYLALPLPQTAGPLLASLVSLLVLASVYLVLAELIGRHIGGRNSERVLGLFSLPVLVVSWMLRPLVFLLIGAANLFLKLFGINVSADIGRVHSSAELERLVERSTASGELDEDEHEMLRGVFGFSDTIAREVMTPRPDLVTVGVDDCLEDVIDTIAGSGRSRFPVVGDSIDNVVGVLLAKDVMRFFSSVTLDDGDASDRFNIRQAMVEPYFIPGSKPIDDLLDEFKLRKLHMAVVLDEHGGVDGAVTLEDLIEEIVGEIYDESDVPETDIVVEDGGDVIIDGGVLVCDINDRLDVKIPEGDYDTIAGFIFSALGRVPDIGDVIELSEDGSIVNPAQSNGSGVMQSDGDAASTSQVGDRPLISSIAVEVESVEGNRIESIRLRRIDGDSGGFTPSDESP